MAPLGNKEFSVRVAVHGIFPKFSGFRFHKKTRAHKKPKRYRQSKQIEFLYSIFVRFYLTHYIISEIFQLPFSPPPQPDHAATPVRAGTQKRTRTLPQATDEADMMIKTPPRVAYLSANHRASGDSSNLDRVSSNEDLLPNICNL